MLSIKDLDLFYGDAQALDRVSLEVPQGEIVAIVGANGAGKSSLIRSIAGIEKPRSHTLGIAVHQVFDHAEGGFLKQLLKRFCGQLGGSEHTGFWHGTLL